MDSGRLLFDSGLARGSGGSGAQMLLFGGGGGVGGFFRGVPRPVLAMEEGRRKRPFFTTHEELIEEEYYDEQAPEKKRRLTADQVQMLEKSFAEENKLEPERKSELARRLGMAPRQVAVWFQNRRARWKTKQLEQDFDYLKAAYDALLADHHALLKDNDRLRSQVISLTEKMECKNMSGSVTATAQEAEPDEQTAVSATDTCTAAMAAAAVQLRGEDIHSTETNGSTVVMDVGEGTNHSGESYIAGEGYNSAGGGAAHSSEEEDGGAVSDEGCSFQLPEAVLTAMENDRHHVVEEEAHLGNWTSWFWN